MGIWDDVDYRKCERCQQTRHVTGMSVVGPARIWICTPCRKERAQLLDEMADFGQEFDNA